MSSSQAESIRKSFRNFVRLYSGLEPPTTLLETTLIRNGSYCGRRFSLLGFSAIWFIDEQQVKLYGQNGALIRSMAAPDFCEGVPIPAEIHEIRRAA